MNPELMGFYGAASDLVAPGGNWPPPELTRAAHFVVANQGAAPGEYIGFGFLSYSGFPRGQVKFNDAILALEPSRAFQAIMWMGKGFAYAARGDWDSSGGAMDRWRRLADDSPASVVAYCLAGGGAPRAAVCDAPG